MTTENGYIILIEDMRHCEDGKQYPVRESQERERLVEVPAQPPEKSSRSIGLNEE